MQNTAHSLDSSTERIVFINRIIVHRCVLIRLFQRLLRSTHVHDNDWGGSVLCLFHLNNHIATKNAASNVKEFRNWKKKIHKSSFAKEKRLHSTNEKSFYKSIDQTWNKMLFISIKNMFHCQLAKRHIVEHFFSDEFLIVYLPTAPKIVQNHFKNPKIFSMLYSKWEIEREKE